MLYTNKVLSYNFTIHFTLYTIEGYPIAQIASRMCSFFGDADNYDRKVKKHIVSSENNTTIAAILNETSSGQQNLPCIFVELIAILCAYCFILLGGFFGNTFIIIFVYKYRELQKTVNYFIVNVAVSDLLFSLIGIPHQIIVFVSVDSSHWASANLRNDFLQVVFFRNTSVSPCFCSKLGVDNN